MSGPLTSQLSTQTDMAVDTSALGTQAIMQYTCIRMATLNIGCLLTA